MDYKLTLNPKLYDLIQYLEVVCNMPRREAIKICGEMFNMIPKKYR